MKIKTVVGVALIIFVLIVGNIIVFGLLQPAKDVSEFKKNNPLKNFLDYNVNIETTNKNKINPDQTTKQETTKNTSNGSTSTNQTNTQKQNVPVVDIPVKPKKVRTRAS